MCSLRLMLGWERLLEADEIALPALRGLCQALNIDTHWDDAESTLYIQSPVAGKRVAVIPVADGSPALENLAGRIATQTAERLSGAGAGVLVVAGEADLRGYSLALRVDVCSLPSWGVSAAYNWLGWSQNRRLASCLAEEVSAAGGLQNLGTRASFHGVRQPGLPVITVLVGRPDATLAARWSGPDYARAVAGGIYRGLARFWADPVLHEIQQLLPQVSPALQPEATVLEGVASEAAASSDAIASDAEGRPAAEQISPVPACEPGREPVALLAAPVLEPMAGSQLGLTDDPESESDPVVTLEPAFALPVKTPAPPLHDDPIDEPPASPVLIVDPEVVIASKAAAVPAGVTQADFQSILGIARERPTAPEPGFTRESKSQPVLDAEREPDRPPMAPFDPVPDNSPAEPGPPPEPIRLIRPFHSRQAPAKRKTLVDPRKLPGSGPVYQFQPPPPATAGADAAPPGISPAGLMRQAQARAAQAAPAPDTRTPAPVTRSAAPVTRSPATVARVIQPGSTVIRFP